MRSSVPVTLVLRICMSLLWTDQILSGTNATTTPGPTPSFVSEPSGSTNVFEYGETRTKTIEMKCRVRDLQPDQKVSWLKGLDDVVISDNHTVRTGYLVDNSRYSIYGNETQGEYNLKITMVSYKTAEFDDGLYQCAVFYDDPALLAAVIRSRFVQQYLYVVPRMMYPQCFVNNASATLTTEVIEGEELLLSCQSDAGTPTVTMMWTHGHPKVLLTNTVSVQNGIASVSYSWNPDANDDTAVFVCSIGHPAFTLPGGERAHTNCSVGPFSVRESSTKMISTVATDVSGTSEEVNGTITTSTAKTIKSKATSTDNEIFTSKSKATAAIVENKTNASATSSNRRGPILIVSCAVAGFLVLLIILITLSVYCVRKSSRKKGPQSRSENEFVENPFIIDTYEGNHDKMNPYESIEECNQHHLDVNDIGTRNRSQRSQNTIHQNGHAQFIDNQTKSRDGSANEKLKMENPEDEGKSCQNLAANDMCVPDRSQLTTDGSGPSQNEQTAQDALQATEDPIKELYATPNKKSKTHTRKKEEEGDNCTNDDDLAYATVKSQEEEKEMTDGCNGNEEAESFGHARNDLEDKLRKNAEGLTYADLDLTELSAGIRNSSDHERTVYAELQV